MANEQVYILWQVSEPEHYNGDVVETIVDIHKTMNGAKQAKKEEEKFAEESDQDYEYNITKHNLLS